MKNIVLLYKFNPYRNRKIIRYATLAEYIGNPNNEPDHIKADSYLSCPNEKNFAYRDGVDTTTKITLSDQLETPDYALIIDPTTEAIESRWFVMDSDLLSGKTTVLTLHRDMIADYYEDVVNAPCFIEKATLNESDPFIFNTENITVNKIKKGETLLQDKSKCAWVVGYLAPNTTAATITAKESIDVDYLCADYSAFTSEFGPGVGAADIIKYMKFDSHLDGNSSHYPTTNTDDYESLYKYLVKFAYQKTNNTLYPYGVVTAQWRPGDTIDIIGNSSYYQTLSALTGANIGLDTIGYKTNNYRTHEGWANYCCNLLNDSKAAMQTQIQSSWTPNLTNALKQYDNKVFKVGDVYFKLTVEQSEGATYGNYPALGTNTANGCVSEVNSLPWTEVVSTASGSIMTGYRSKGYYLKGTQIFPSQISVDIDADVRTCQNVPYKMFAMPYSKLNTITVSDGTDTASMTGDIALRIAKEISATYSGSQTLYDLQLLPYCPDQTIINSEYSITVPAGDSKCAWIVDGNDTKVGLLYWCADNTGTFDIAHSITVDNVKMDSITEQYRISSPNWNGQFEFNPAKNGSVSLFNVDYTYKPHTPYIHINPNFGRLYGEDFDDARGLICAGDFSLPQTSDAWNNYEIQNKNYQNQFQRDIESLELTQSIQMKQQKFNALTGIATGAISGGATGAAIGGGAGAIGGAIAGAGLSAVGAAMDIKYQKQLNEEAIDYRQDQFGFQLENIKALPQNLTNVGGLTANNKIWPVLEHYSCTDEEKEALRLKLFYNGMTVDRIGTIGEFLQSDFSYIKGKLIWLTINEDNHFVESIANELNRGVFIR